MFWHYLKVAIVQLKKQKIGLGIAIIGLAISIMATALLASYCAYYLDYDRNVDNHEQWYRLRLSRIDPMAGEILESGFYSEITGLILNEIPQISEYLVHVQNYIDFNLTCDDKPFPMLEKAGVTSNFTEHFKIRTIYGNPDSLLVNNRSMIISKSFAERVFGDKNPVGYTVYVKTIPRWVISGVFEDLPQNLHIRTDIYHLRFDEDEEITEKQDYLLRNHVRVRIPDKESVKAVEARINQILEENPLYSDHDLPQRVHLDPVSKMHYVTGLRDDEPTLPIRNILAIIALAVLIFGAALLNFINIIRLSWQRRSDELYFRRNLGAGKADIFIQLLIEYIVYYILASGLGFILYKYSFESFSALVNLSLESYYVLNYALLVLPALALWGIVCGLILGVRYARISLEASSSRHRQRQGGSFVLLTVQMMISLIFIALSLAVSSQFRYIQNLDWGFDAKNTVQYRFITLLNRDVPGYQKGEVARARIREIPGVIKESASGMNLVSDKIGMGNGLFEFQIQLDGMEELSSQFCLTHSVQPDFFETRKIQTLYGTIPEEATEAQVVVNETFAKTFTPGASPLGRSFVAGEGEDAVRIQIVAVVNDTWFHSMHERMRPVVYFIKPMGLDYFQVTYDPARKQEVLNSLDSLFQDLASGGFLGFHRIDLEEQRQELYRMDDIYQRLSISFAILIVLISLMGVYAVSSLHIDRQMKDIAIRKVCGADLKDLVKFYFRQYLIVFLSATVFGVYLSYKLIQMYIDRFSVQQATIWLAYPIALLILAAMVFVPLYINILRAWKQDPNKYLQSE